MCGRCRMAGGRTAHCVRENHQITQRSLLTIGLGLGIANAA